MNEQNADYERRNAARCDLCGDEIESTHVHDFRTCKCGNLSVDGGHFYLRRLWSVNQWTELSVGIEPPRAIHIDSSESS